ncbi:MAG: hypothetical protein ACETWR_07690 [Anaerolineae bacterium]
MTFERLVFRFRMGQIQAIIDWLRYCRRVFLPDTPTAENENGAS